MRNFDNYFLHDKDKTIKIMKIFDSFTQSLFLFGLLLCFQNFLWVFRENLQGDILDLFLNFLLSIENLKTFFIFQIILFILIFTFILWANLVNDKNAAYNMFRRLPYNMKEEFAHNYLRFKAKYENDPNWTLGLLHEIPTDAKSFYINFYQAYRSMYWNRIIDYYGNCYSIANSNNKKTTKFNFLALYVLSKITLIIALISLVFTWPSLWGIRIGFLIWCILMIIQKKMEKSYLHSQYGLDYQLSNKVLFFIIFIYVFLAPSLPIFSIYLWEWFPDTFSAIFLMGIIICLMFFIYLFMLLRVSSLIFSMPTDYYRRQGWIDFVEEQLK